MERREERSQARFVYQTLKTAATSYDERRNLVRHAVLNEDHHDIEIFGSTKDAYVVVVSVPDLERVRKQPRQQQYDFIDVSAEILDQTDMIYLINTTLTAEIEAAPLIDEVNREFAQRVVPEVGRVLSSLQPRTAKPTRRYHLRHPH